MNNPLSTFVSSSLPGLPLDSTEVRWFVGGSVPEDIATRFEALTGAAGWDERRTDLYLVPTDPALGVKVRCGRLELKRRLSAVSPLSLGRSAVGVVEKWRKWGFSVQHESEPLPSSGDWFPVEKRRSAVVFGPDLRVRPLDRAIPSTDPRGCLVELCSVSLFPTRPHWTFCLEAFGPGEGQDLLLTQIGEFIMGAFPDLVLALTASCGYPSWILHQLRLQARTETRVR